jgi:hypothetical protein
MVAMMTMMGRGVRRNDRSRQNDERDGSKK